MAEKESYATGREALEEVLDESERSSERENALLRYLGGVAYQEERQEARERRDEPAQEDRR
jgi:hypothetical protein